MPKYSVEVTLEEIGFTVPAVEAEDAEAAKKQVADACRAGESWVTEYVMNTPWDFSMGSVYEDE